MEVLKMEKMIDRHKDWQIQRTGGFSLYRTPHGSRIYLVEAATRIIELGQMVRSNGRVHFAEGTVGIVIRFLVPGVAGRTSDIIEVFFEGATEACAMKPKDLDFTPIEVKSVEEAAKV